VIGSKPYEAAAEIFGKPVVIAGFRTARRDAVVLMLIRQINEGRRGRERIYARRDA
jgi:hydrogenase expression/formation protein HypD